MIPALKLGWEAGIGALSIVPKPVWYVLGALALVLLARWGVVSYGDSRYEQGKIDLLAQQAKQAERQEDEQEKVTERVVVEYRDRIQIVEVKGDTIIKEVPVYVTAKDDANCTINAGFVRLWNDANTGEVSEASPGADAAPGGVSLSEVGTQKAIEAKLCRRTEQQLISLQAWVQQQYELSLEAERNK